MYESHGSYFHCELVDGMHMIKDELWIPLL